MMETETQFAPVARRLRLRGRHAGAATEVCPMPPQVTFGGGDAVTANSYHVPSYEIVTSSGLRNFGEDNVHLRPRVVSRVVDYMLSRYVT